MPKTKKHKNLKKFRQKLSHTTGLLQTEPENTEENFVFPIFHNTQPKNNPQPNILKNKKNHNENWLQDLEQQKETQRFRNIFDFDSPAIEELPQPKHKFHRPQKTKHKANVKLDLAHEFFNYSNKPQKKKIKYSPPKVLSPLQRAFKLIFEILISPFRFLDFLVDSTLKLIWLIIKNFFLGLYKIFELFIVNLITLIRFLFKRRINFNSNFSLKTNYKPILSFVLICLVIVLPLQILSLKEKTTVIKGEVLGKSMQGLDLLKQAGLFSQKMNFSQASDNFNQAYLNFEVAQNYMQDVDIFSKSIIKLVPQATQADNLLTIGQLSSSIGEKLTILAQKLSALSETEDLNLIAKLSITQETLQNIEPDFLKLLEHIEKIDTSVLAKYLEQKDLEKIQLLVSSTSALKNNFNNLKTLTSFLFEFLGSNQTKNYLVIFQNNSELRPTGGFMGSYALVEIKNGKILDMNVPGGGFYDLKAAAQTTVEAPQPFHLFSPYWQIWNANWFPDWPASAKKISNFYEESINGISLDGVIALTPDVIEDFLDIIGPIEMPEYEVTISSDNFVREIQEEVELEYDPEENQPKKIIGDLMPIFLDSIFNLKTDNVPQFLSLLSNNLKQKNILFWLADEKLEQVVENFNWAGEIKNNSNDFLMVVHTNVGGGKTDRVIDNTLQHSVEINEKGEIIDTLTLTRKHNGQIGDIFEDQNNVDYVRFYVPQGSTLISASGFQQIPTNLFKVAANQKTLTPDEDLLKLEENPILDERFDTRITQEFNKTCFGNWLMVKPGEEKTATIKYKLPFKLEKSEATFWQKLFNSQPDENLTYSLYVQKQSGLATTDFTSQINLPSDFELNNSISKNNLQENNSQIIYQDDLETDGYYALELK